ncbi:MAG: 50S ribosomal protein L32, partial [bacterium]
MAALPKKKISKTRGRTRRAHQRVSLLKLIVCPKCKAPKLPHRMCGECG